MTEESHLPDRDIVEGLLARDVGAATALYDRNAGQVNQLVWRMLGADREHDAVVQQVFAHALADIPKLRDLEALGPWLTSITVQTVRHELRKRQTHFTVELPQITAQVFGILAGMRADDRIAFTLRFVEGFNQDECATACGCSQAAWERRLASARRTFVGSARSDSTLASWVKDETRILEGLGRQVAEELGPVRHPERIRLQRRSVQALVHTASQGGNRFLLAAGIAAAAAVLTFALLELLVPVP